MPGTQENVANIEKHNMWHCQGLERTKIRTILRHQKDQRVSRVQKQAPMMKMTPTKVLEPKALMAHMKPVWLQSLLKGSGGEMADQTQKMMWMKKNRKKMAYVNALSLMAALYTRMYLRAMRQMLSVPHVVSASATSQPQHTLPLLTPKHSFPPAREACLTSAQKIRRDGVTGAVDRESLHVVAGKHARTRKASGQQGGCSEVSG